MSLPCLEQAVLLHLSSMHIHELPFGALVLVSRLRVYLPPYPFALTFPVHFEIYIVAHPRRVVTFTRIAVFYIAHSLPPLLSRNMDTTWSLCSLIFTVLCVYARWNLRDGLSLFLDPVVCLFLFLSNRSFFKIVRYLSLELFISVSQILSLWILIYSLQRYLPIRNRIFTRLVILHSISFTYYCTALRTASNKRKLKIKTLWIPVNFIFIISTSAL